MPVKLRETKITAYNFKGRLKQQMQRMGKTEED